MKFIKIPKFFRRSGRGSVALIAMLLITSAVLRLASGAGVAIAAAASDNDLKTSATDHATSTTLQETSSNKNTSRSEMSNLLVALQEREVRIKERESQIDVRSKALKIVGEEITKRLAVLEKAEAQLRSTLALADGAAEGDLARLTSVYENMKPKDAAALFEMMEPDFAAGFLGRMRPDAAAALMAGLTPDAAYSISVILASRNASVPKS